MGGNLRIKDCISKKHTLSDHFLCLSSEMGPPTNLVTSDVTETSFAVSWTAAPGNVKMYQVQWQSMYTEETGETAVPGNVTNTVLHGLSPETLYQVSVVASYQKEDSEPLTGQETTDGKTQADGDIWRHPHGLNHQNTDKKLGYIVWFSL